MSSPAPLSDAKRMLLQKYLRGEFAREFPLLSLVTLRMEIECELQSLMEARESLPILPAYGCSVQVLG